jgi:hypothetical protein
MSEIGALIDGTPFLRARRNLVLMSAIILIYATGAIEFTANGGAFLGLPVRLGHRGVVEVWLLIFWVYFLWRYHASLDGNHPTILIMRNIEKTIRNVAEIHAWSSFKSKWVEIASEPDKYTVKVVGPHLYPGFFLGPISVPVYGLAWPGRAATIDKTEDGYSKYNYVLPQDEALALARTAFREQILTHNAFSEMLWPYIVATVAFLALVAHAAWHLICHFAH